MTFRQATLSICLLLLGSFASSSHATEPRRIVAFGDSITRGLGDGSTSCSSTDGGYPSRLASRLAADDINVDIVNQGKCQEETADGLTRIDGVLSTDDDLVILMEGTNDFSVLHSPSTAQYNVEEMARKAEEKGVTPIILAVIPRGPGGIGDVNNTLTANFATLLAEGADLEKRWFADPYNEFRAVPNLFSSYYTDILHPNSEGYALLTDVFEDSVRAALIAKDTAAPLLTCDDVPSMPSPCVVDEETLCLRDGRFALDVAWRRPARDTGKGRAALLTADTGTFWFFAPENIELIIKVLDGRPRNGHFWLYYGSLSDVEYALRVTDTETGSCRVYGNPAGNFASVGDTAAFAAD